MSGRKPVKVKSKNKDFEEGGNDLLTSESSEDGSNRTITEMTIEELSRKLSQARHDVDRSHEQLRSHKNVIARLLKALNEVKRENRNLAESEKEQVLELENQLRIATADLERAGAQGDEQRGALEAANARIVELEEQCQEKDAEIADLKKLVSDLKKELGTQQTVINELQKKVKESEEKGYAMEVQMGEVLKALALLSSRPEGGATNDKGHTGSARDGQPGN